MDGYLSHIDENGDHELSAASEDVFARHWPDTLTPAHPLFQRRMLELQVALIKSHVPTMYASDLARARKTLSFLKQEIARV